MRSGSTWVKTRRGPVYPVAGGFPQPSQAYVRRAHAVVRADTYNVVAVQGSPARSDLCFPKWVAACWPDPDLGDTRATLKERHKKKTQHKNTRYWNMKKTQKTSVQKLRKLKQHKTRKDKRYWHRRRTQKTSVLQVYDSGLDLQHNKYDRIARQIAKTQKIQDMQKKTDTTTKRHKTNLPIDSFY